MESETNNETVEQEVEKSSLHTVTPLSKYLAMALFIILPFAGGWIGYHYAPEKVVEVERVVVKEVETKAKVDEKASPLSVADLYYPCQSSDGFVVYEISRDMEVGSDFIVQKNASDMVAGKSCSYFEKPDDYVLADFDASYLETVYKNLLVLDSGTGPGPRGLSVYDLSKRETVFEGSYMSSSLEIEGSKLTYWEPVDRLADVENCPVFEENVGYGLGSGFEERVTLELTTLLLERTGQVKCSARQ